MKIARVSTVETIPASRLARPLPANVTVRDQPSFDRILRAEIPEVRILEVLNASVLYSGHLVLNWSDLTLASYRNDEGEIVRLNAKDIVKVKLLNRKERLPASETFLVAHSLYSHTYYHWMVEVLPRLYLLRSDIETGTLLLPDNHSSTFHRESLALFGVNRILFMKQKTAYVAPRLKIATQIGSHANYHGSILEDTTAFLKKRLTLPWESGNRIYVSRGLAHRRKVLNEGEVIQCLRRFGFMVLHLEHYPVAEQIKMMHGCSILIGIHGAGLANMIFMKRGGAILEFRKDDRNVNYAFFALAATFGHHYFYQFCRSPDENALVQDADIHVDVKQLEVTVRTMVEMLS